MILNLHQVTFLEHRFFEYLSSFSNINFTSSFPFLLRNLRSSLYPLYPYSIEKDFISHNLFQSLESSSNITFLSLVYPFAFIYDRIYNTIIIFLNSKTQFQLVSFEIISNKPHPLRIP